MHAFIHSCKAFNLSRLFLIHPYMAIIDLLGVGSIHLDPGAVFIFVRVFEHLNVRCVVLRLENLPGDGVGVNSALQWSLKLAGSGIEVDGDYYYIWTRTWKLAAQRA